MPTSHSAGLTSKSHIAFFDVDHTLTHRSTGYYFALRAVRLGLISPLLLAEIPRLYLQYRRGRLDPASLASGSPRLAGKKRSDLERVATEAFELHIQRDLRPAALELASSLKERGEKLILATSSLDIIVEPIARALGADEVLASRLEYDAQERTTGRLAGPPVFGFEKLERARALALDFGLKLSDCAFFTDSVHDLPLLLEVGRPVAVNPDRGLRREAKRRGWEILRL
jgi:HAD superfamily hydrolase (TIGR01490 family)